MGVIHFLLWFHVDESNRPLVHKFIAFIGQVGGAAVVFYAINGTLSSFKGTSLNDFILQWWKSAPWFPPKKITGTINGVFGGGELSVHGIATPKFSSIEERVEYIHNKLDQLDTAIYKQGKETKQEITKVEKKLNRKIDQTYGKIEGKMIKNSEDELTPQLCGFMMVIYGVITSLSL